MVADSLWLPRSSCGPTCLPAPGVVPEAGPLLLIVRALKLLLVLVTVAATAPLLLLLLQSRPVPPRFGRQAARTLLWALGVRHEVHGHLPGRATLVVANHMSWLDVLILARYLPVRLVARHDVRDWPVVGWLARAAGAVFIDRSRPRDLPGTVKQVEAALRTGSAIAMFPEGTTWCGNEGGRFRPALFQAAIDAGVAVTPVTVEFRLTSGATTTVAAFVGDDNLLASIRRVASAQGVQINVRIHSALHPVPGACRRALARATQSSITGTAPTAVGGRPTMPRPQVPATREVPQRT